MFVQIIRGRARDRDGFRKQLEIWQEQLAPGATGWLGGTGGVAADGEFLIAARFADEPAARHNSDRPEQGEWWAETARLLDGDARFYDCTDIDVIEGGGSDEAGFVQVIEGRARDPEEVRRFGREAEPLIREHRPDIIGSISCWHGDEFTELAYFTSERAARAGEAAMAEGPLAGLMERWLALVEDLRFIDLTDPWLASP